MNMYDSFSDIRGQLKELNDFCGRILAQQKAKRSKPVVVRKVVRVFEKMQLSTLGRFEMKKFAPQLYNQGSRLVSVDETGVGENLFKRNDAGVHHLVKRLDHTRGLFCLLDLQKSNLKGISHVVVGGFRADHSYVPKEGTAKKSAERLHVSLAPKIVVKGEDGGDYQLSGKLKCNGKQTTLNNFLQVVDIGSGVINRIDDVLEAVLRYELAGLMTSVLKGHKRPKGAYFEFKASYVETLKAIEKDIDWSRPKEVPKLLGKVNLKHTTFAITALKSVLSDKRSNAIISETIKFLQ